MRNRGLLVRLLLGLGLLCGAVLALASSIVLHGAVLVVVLVVAALAGIVAYAAPENHRARSLELAGKVAGGTLAVALLVGGLAVLTGGAATTVVIGLAIVGGGCVWLRRRSLQREGGGARPRLSAAPADGSPAAMLPVAWQPQWQIPVGLLPTAALGCEWLETTSALARPVGPAARQDIIRRREEALDELERRDPTGFARWLAAGAAADSDPATFVRREWSTDSDAA